MDITPYVDRLRADLARAAAAADEPVRDAAERLTAALDPALRLTLMEVLSEAAAEITSALPAGSVEARLHGRDVELVLDRPEPATAEAPTGSLGDDHADEGDLARITVRIPEAIKTRAEELATQGGQSLNTWIVTVLRGATRGGPVAVPSSLVDIDLSSMPFVDQDFPFGRKGGPRRMTGWV